jgi:hypothetical protein
VTGPQTTFLQRHPALLYSALMLLGALGVYVSTPIFFSPQTTLEWIDLSINLIIFVPSATVTVGSGVLAILSAAFSYRLDKKGRFERFAKTVLKMFGIPGFLLPEFAMLTPLGLVVAIFTKSHSGRSISEVSNSDAEDE